MIGTQPAGYPLGRSNIVQVTGPGSVWFNQGALSVGPYNSFNELRIEDGATVLAGSASIGNATDTVSNRVVISNGALFVTNAAGLATLNVLRGALHLNGGTILIDHINAGLPQSLLDFSAGALTVKGMVVNNSRPLLVGDGVASARLTLAPGTHSFAHGLAILPNAALTASGLLNASLTNSGELAIGSIAASLTLNGSLHLNESATTTFDLGGLTPGTQHDFLNVSNVVRFGGRLRIGVVNGFVPASNSVFTLMRFAGASGTFVNAPSGTRIRLENSNVTCLVDYSGSVLRLSNFQNANPATIDIDESWALRYFGHFPLTYEERVGDADGDGLDNYSEYVAGTDPLDEASVLRMTLMRLNAEGHATLQFKCVSNKTYCISYSDDLMTWSDVASPALSYPSPEVCEWIDDGSATGGTLPSSSPPRFYRISVW